MYLDRSGTKFQDESVCPRQVVQLHTPKLPILVGNQLNYSECELKSKWQRFRSILITACSGLLIIQIYKTFQCLTLAYMCIIKHLIQFFSGSSIYSGLGIKISIVDNRHLLCQEKAMKLGLQFHWSTDRTWLTGTT